MMEWCQNCGQLHDEATTEKLWDIYHRIRDGRSSYEPLVFYSDWLQENVHDEDDVAAVNLAMEKDMHRRGLCIICGRPDLRRVTPDMVMTKEEAQEIWDMWAEQAAERRAGC
jgi:hypothetical protein